ncbi:hypothetical protein ACIBOV_27510 [Micromonospora chersina]|uniref:hypothetical protein n=1 Tax=Micromonospora chersina TaxID=47854 RepID=UPI00379B4036
MPILDDPARWGVEPTAVAVLGESAGGTITANGGNPGLVPAARPARREILAFLREHLHAMPRS